VDGWWLGGGLLGVLLKIKGTRAAKDVYDPKTIGDRRSIARICASTLDHGIPTYVDETDDQVNRAYAAWPTRLYLIGLDGRVVYAGGGLGPFGFKPSALEKAIVSYLSQSAG